MKHLTIEVAELEGVPAAFLHCEPLTEALPAPVPLPISEKADAGHIAAMALYRSYGEDVVIEVTPEAFELLEPDLVVHAQARGVSASVGADEWIVLVLSDDGSRTVELRLPTAVAVS